MRPDVIEVARLASRAELGWVGSDGLRAVAVTPVVIDGAVAALLPFAQAALARRLADARAAAVVFSDSRMALRGWASCAAAVRVDVTADRDASWTWTGALDQLVRKHPPSRAMLDTPIQRREHWWYVPRWVVRLFPVGAPVRIARRAGPDDGVLFVERVDAPALLGARPVSVRDWEADPLRVTPLGEPHSSEEPVPALVFTHDVAVPDQERSSAYEVVGELVGGEVTVVQRRGSRCLPSDGLVARLRRHWRMERACRRALAAYDAGSPSVAAT